MLQIVKYELYKVITKRLFWYILAVALVVNALALWWLNPPSQGGTGEAEGAYDYQAYLDWIDQEAHLRLNSAVFDQDIDSFSTRNIIKTQQDFADMRDIETQHDVNDGIAVLLDSPSADIIVALLIITICIALISDEKDKRLFLLVKATPNGHMHTIAAKLTATAVCVVGVSGLIFLSGLFFAEITYGFGDVQRSIQSVPEYVGCPLRVSVAGFIMLQFFAKTAGLLCIAMLVMLIAIHAKHAVIVVSVAALAAIGSVLLAAIPVVSSLNILRFLNLYSLVVPHRIFGNYFNLNIFGNPVRLIPVFVAFTAILFVASAFAVCLSFVKKRGLSENAVPRHCERSEAIQRVPACRVFLDCFGRKLPRNDGVFGRSGQGTRTSWQYFEFKKLAFVNKALIILAVFAVLQGYLIYSADDLLFGADHLYYREMLLDLQGDLTEEKENSILELKERYDYAQSELFRLYESFYSGEININAYMDQSAAHMETLEYMAGFPVIYERYEYVRDTENAQFLYDSGYAELFGMKDADSGGTRGGASPTGAGMWLIAVLLLCLCGVFSVEYKTGMYRILNSTVHGNRDTIRLKLLFSASLTAIAFALASLPELVFIGRNFGYSGIALPLASVYPTATGSIPAFMGGLPIWGYIVLMLLLRLLVFAGIALIISALSLKIKSNAYAALAGAGILLLPLFLQLFGFDLLDALSLRELVGMGGIIAAPGVFKVTQAFAFAGIAVLCGVYVTRKFGKV